MCASLCLNWPYNKTNKETTKKQHNSRHTIYSEIFTIRATTQAATKHITDKNCSVYVGSLYFFQKSILYKIFTSAEQNKKYWLWMLNCVASAYLV